MSLDDLVKAAQLAQLLLIPAVVFGGRVALRLVRAIDRMEAFMEESKQDRARLHAQLDPIERALIAKGIVQ